MAQGRHKAIDTPDELWGMFIDYSESVKANPRKMYVLAPKTSEMIVQPLEVPLTKEGFYNYVASNGLISTLKDYFSNRDGRYDDFVPICTRIIDQIRQDQIEGGMVGQYNASLTARINGLADKTETTTEVTLPTWFNSGIPKPDA